MNKILKVTFCCLLFLAFNSAVLAQQRAITDPCGDPTAESSAWELIRGKVLKVEDGDTITIAVDGQGVKRIHLNGIDAPDRGERFGEASWRLLERLLSNKTVDVSVKMSMASRVLREIAGVVHIREMEHLDVNQLMIQSGLARHKKSEPYTMSSYAECHYVKAEEDARNARRGIWR